MPAVLATPFKFLGPTVKQPENGIARGGSVHQPYRHISIKGRSRQRKKGGPAVGAALRQNEGLRPASAGRSLPAWLRRLRRRFRLHALTASDLLRQPEPHHPAPELLDLDPPSLLDRQ